MDGLDAEGEGVEVGVGNDAGVVGDEGEVEKGVDGEVSED